MADRDEFPKENPSSSNPSLRLLGSQREEGEVSSGGEDESVLGRAPNLEPSNLSFTSNTEKSMKIGANTTSSQPNMNPISVPGSNPSLQRIVPQTITPNYRSKSYNKRMPYNKLPANRNLSWQKKRPLDDHNLVISFSDDESESDTTPANAQVRPQVTKSSGLTNSMARNSILGPNGSAQRPNTTLHTRASSSQSNGAPLGSKEKVLETLRHEIALREKSLKIQKVGSIQATDGRQAKRAKVESLSNGIQSGKDCQLHFNASPLGYAKGDSNQYLSRQNGDINRTLSALDSGMVLSKADNGNSEDNGRLVLNGTHQPVDMVMQSDVSAWLNQNTENTDSQAELQLLLEQEDAQDRELEQAQYLRRRLEREEREAFKAYRKAQRALFEANEKCNHLQKKRDLLSSQVNSLLENSSTSNTPWPLCWNDPRESPSDQPADGFHIAVSRDDNREEGQLTDSTNTKDQLEEAVFSDVDKRGSPSGNSSPQDYEALEASLRSELVARYRNKAPLSSTKSAERDAIDHPFTENQGNLVLSPNHTQESPSATTPLTQSVSNYPSAEEGKNLPSKDFMQSTVERMVDQFNLFPRDVIDQPSKNSQENVSLSPNKTQGSPCELTPTAHPIHMSSSVGGINLQSKRLAGSAEGNLVNQENLPFGGPEDSNTPSPNVSHELPLVNVSTSNSTCVSLTEPKQTPSKLITEPAAKKPGEYSTTVTLKITSELAVSPFVLPPSTVKNACLHFKHMANSYDALNGRYEVVDIVNELEQARDDTGVSGPQVDPFWPFCIFELRGRCNDPECRWQHVKDFEWRRFKPENFLTSPSGVYQHVVHVPTHQIGSCLIKDGPYVACSVQVQGSWQHWQRGTCALFPVPVSLKRSMLTDAPCLSFPEAPPIEHQYNEISSLKLYLEEDLPEAENCLELALNSSLAKQKVLLMLSRALERNPKSVLLWTVYLHIYYMKKKDIGKDDMFLDAVHNNKYSYDLWLMYINSRPKLEDQLSAFSDALATMCQLEPTSKKEQKDQSSIILDLYLHMVNTLCMSGNTEMAISRVFNFSSDELLTTIISSLVVADKCIFWVTSIYLSAYGKLPEGILEQFKFDKDLYFVIDWPSIHFRSNDEIRVLGLFEHAFVDVGFTEMDPNSPKSDVKYLKELHFLAISHVKCMAAVRGLNGATDLLVKYKKIFPNCVELALVLARLGDHATCTYSNQGVVSNGFETVISDWRSQPQGVQCIWNQYAEHFLASKRFDLARDLLSDWYRETKLEAFTDAKSGSNDFISLEEQLFGLLNLCLYQLLRDDSMAAHFAVDKALKLADQKLYKHCLREHVIVCLLKESLVNQRDISSQVVLDLIGNYLRDARTRPVRKILSRKFYQDIKRTRTRQLLDEWLGPVSDDYSLVNSILEMCYGESLIPEKSGIKELVNLVESVTQISPANYWFALSVCRFVIRKFEFDDISTMSVRFWTGSVLINTIFQCVPVASEPVWVEGAEVLVNLKLFEISNRFLEQAVSVYPFSLKLWQLYSSLSKRMNENGSRIIEAAKRRGIGLLA